MTLLRCSKLSAVADAAVALLALAVSGDAGSFRGELVSLGAVSGCATGSAGYSATNSWRESADNILPVSDGFKVVRVDAAANAARMVKLHAVCDRPDVQFVGNAMGGRAARITTADQNTPVASAICESEPYPAAGFGDDFDVSEQALLDARTLAHRAILRLEPEADKNALYQYGGA